jgi:hypothetical protein
MIYVTSGRNRQLYKVIQSSYSSSGPRNDHKLIASVSWSTPQGPSNHMHSIPDSWFNCPWNLACDHDHTKTSLKLWTPISLSESMFRLDLLSLQQLPPHINSHAQLELLTMPSSFYANQLTSYLVNRIRPPWATAFEPSRSQRLQN